MPASVALAGWFICLILLLRYDPARDPEASLALWIPLIWMFFVGSRNPTQWLSAGAVSAQAQSMQEGSPIDRAIFTALIVLSVAVLISRSFLWGRFLRQNIALAI